MKNKKGLSTIVVTLIILVITLVFVGILYAIYNNVIGTSTQQVDFVTLCQDSGVRVTSTECTAVAGGQTCYVNVAKTGSKNPSQVKVSVINDAGLAKAIAPAAFASQYTVTPVTGTPTKVIITPYVLSGTPAANTECPNVIESTI